MVWDVQTEAIGLLPSPAAGPSGRGIGANGLPEIAEDDVHHGAAPVGAAAARRGLARCADQLFVDFFGSQYIQFCLQLLAVPHGTALYAAG